ncbi:hypothetical protein ACLOJK_022406 [Asimina triloba]
MARKIRRQGKGEMTRLQRKMGDRSPCPMSIVAKERERKIGKGGERVEDRKWRGKGGRSVEINDEEEGTTT